MGFWGAVCGAVSSAVSFVGSCVSSLGKAVVGMASTLIKELAPVIDTVVTIIKLVAEHFGVLKPEDDIEDLGARAMKSDKKVEDFDSVNDYIDHLRNDIELEKDELKKMNEGQKLACKAVGSTITSKALSEKIGIEIPADFWVEVGKHSMTFKETLGLIEAYKNNNMPIQFADYLKGNMKFMDRVKNESVIVNTYKEINPEMTTEEIEDKLMLMSSK